MTVSHCRGYSGRRKVRTRPGWTGARGSGGMGVCALQTAAECWSLVPLGAVGAVSRGLLLCRDSQCVVQVAPLAYLLHAPTLCCAEGAVVQVTQASFAARWRSSRAGFGETGGGRLFRSPLPLRPAVRRERAIPTRVAPNAFWVKGKTRAHLPCRTAADAWAVSGQVAGE